MAERLHVGALWDGVRLRRDMTVTYTDGRVTSLEHGSTDPADAALIAVPGLVNAHQHGRATSTAALGIPDAPLERWLLSQLGMYPTDLHAETAALAQKLLANGVTSTVHVHGSGATDAEAFDAEIRTIAAAYSVAGVNVSIAVEIRDRGLPVMPPHESLLIDLPQRLRSTFDAVGRTLAPEAVVEVVESLVADSLGAGRLGCATVIFGPPGYPWNSTEQFSFLARHAARLGIGVQTHLLESSIERSFGYLDYAGGTVAALRESGLLDVQLSVAHAVWASHSELSLLGRAGAALVTNPSSNLRLHAGVAPLREALDRGVPVALGTDNLCLADDESLLGEARLARGLQRTRSATLSARDVWTMLTSAGGSHVGLPEAGRLRVGGPADIVLLATGRPLPANDEQLLEVALQHGSIRKVVVGGVPVLLGDRPAPPSWETDSAARELASELSKLLPAHLTRIVDRAGKLPPLDGDPHAETT